MQGLRKFDVHGSLKDGGKIVLPTRYAKIASSSENANRANRVMPGRFIVQCTAGSNTNFDGASAANTTGTPGRLIAGLVLTVCDTRGRRRDKQILETTESGLVIFAPARNIIFKGLEDGVGGGIADAGGFASMVLGTPTGDDQDEETHLFTPMPNDEIDSSSIASGTNANRAFALMSPLGDITNTDTARRIWRFTITDAFSTVI